jgi:CRP-like cAMP-binding protein
MLIAYIAGWLSTSYSIRRYRFVWAFRVLLILYAIIMIIWCETQSFADDQLSYAIITMIVCLGHWAYIMYHERPITLNDYLHNLWHKMFNMNGYNLELLDFYNLMQEKAFLKTYHRNSHHVYINEGDVPAQLSILLSGKMAIWKRDDWQRKDLFMAHHTTEWERKRQEQPDLDEKDANYGAQYAFCGNVYPYEFIDSYEWLMGQGVSKFEGGSQPTPGCSQVMITVANSSETDFEECVVLTWKTEMLEAIFKEHPRLRVCIHSLVGKDIADKMLRICGHGVDKMMPDVDMVRAAHASLRPTLRADVKNAHQTEMERQVLPVPSNRAKCIWDDSYKIVSEDGENGDVEVKNLQPLQEVLKARLGHGPWLDLLDSELKNKHCPWEGAIVEQLVKDEKEEKPGAKQKLAEMGYGQDAPRPDSLVDPALLEQAQHSLQRSRLRVTNSRLLGMNPGMLESLQPSSDTTEQNKIHGHLLLKFFDNHLPDLRKRDLYEILKWGKWRTYYRPGTVLVRQGEEAHYVGLVLQGRLALYTEDEITRAKSLVTYVEKNDLVGSEDFSSKFRTARRTIQMPRFEEIPEYYDPTTNTSLPQQLSRTVVDGEVQADTPHKQFHLYTKMNLADARSFAQNDVLDVTDRDYITERCDTAKEHDENEIVVTTIPTVMYIWDIKDLKRLMLADPHVESALSHLLRSDITYKLSAAAPSALGTRLCGVPTQARGDQDIRMCGVEND